MVEKVCLVARGTRYAHHRTTTRISSSRRHPSWRQLIDQTAKLTINLADRSEQAYFLKVALGEDGMSMLNGELESMTYYTAVPEFVPKPYAWGSYKDIPDMHFFM